MNFFIENDCFKKVSRLLDLHVEFNNVLFTLFVIMLNVNTVVSRETIISFKNTGSFIFRFT